MEQIKIAVAEKHDMLRASIVDFLYEENQFEIVFDTSGAMDLMDKLSNWKVDVLFLSTSLIGLDGETALKIIRDSKGVSDLKIILFSSLTNSIYIKEMMMLGANSVLKKYSDSDTIVECIQTVYLDKYYFNDYFTKELLETTLMHSAGN